MPDTTDDLYRCWNAMKLEVSADGSDNYRIVATPQAMCGKVCELDPPKPRATR
jgi:hypothetical protein